MESEALKKGEQTLFFTTTYMNRKGSKDGLELLCLFQSWFSDEKEGEYFKYRVNNYIKHVKVDELMGLLDLNPSSIVAKLKKKFEDEDSECSFTTAKKIKVEPLNHKILTDWLKSKGLDVEFDNIGNYFSKGIRLLQLLRACSKRPLPKEAKSAFDVCFLFFENRYFDLGITIRQDIENGNLTETVNLLWKMYDFFEIGCIQPEVSSGKIGLLKWWQMKISCYKNVKIVDFWTSFRDGLAFCAMINLYHPKLLNYEELCTTNPKHNLCLALEVAERELGIASVFSGKELLESSSSFEPFVVRYAAQFYHAFDGPRKVRKVDSAPEICFMCQHRAADLTSLYEHLKCHAYFLHKDERGVDDVIVNQYKVEETECGLEGCPKVFPRLVDVYWHWKKCHKFVLPCMYLHCQFVTWDKICLKTHLERHYRYLPCPGCQKGVDDCLTMAGHYKSDRCSNKIKQD